MLAIIAEFERDILTERIQDNLMELAKDGRWLGGKTPTGFSSQRVTTGSGKNKSAISFLVPVQEEKEIVLEIYSTFWETRSLLQTAISSVRNMKRSMARSYHIHHPADSAESNLLRGG